MAGSKAKVIKMAYNQVSYNSIYIWGGQGEKARNLTIKKIKKMENSPANASRVLKHIADVIEKITLHTRSFDCSGLIIWLFIKAGLLPKDYDTTADGLMRKYKEVQYSELLPGDLCYKTNSDTGKAYHVGLYVGDNTVIEAAGRDKGVIYSYSPNTWNKFNRPNYN